MFLSIKSYLRVRIALAGVMAVFLTMTPVFNIRQADAAIPQTINYQSRLLTPGGLAVTSTTAIQLSFYLHPTNGAPGDAAGQAGPLVWKEVYDQGSGACSMITPDAKGYFFLKLGSCNPFPAYLDFSEVMYVGVKIGADAEASPRVQLSSHPYALNAYRLNGYEATSTATANQLLALDSNLNFNIATGTFTGAGLFINGTSTLQEVTFTVATGTSLNLTQYLAIGAIRLDATGTNNQTSGAYLVGVFDEFTNSNATTVQAALYDLDTAITTVSSTLYAMDLQQVTDNGATTTNRIQFAGATSVGDIIPGAHDTYTLGNSDLRWAELWSGVVHVGTSTWDLAQADNGAFTISGNAGSERMRILADGKVGIGLRAPEQMLSVRDTLLVGQYEGIIPPAGKSANFILRATDGFSPGIQGSAYTYFQRDANDIARFGITPNNSINLDHWDGLAWLSRMVISSIGFVGVGTSAPSTLLHVQGGINGAALLTLDADDGNAWGRDAGIIINSDLANGSDAAFIEFANNGSTAGKMYSTTFDSGFMTTGNIPFRVYTNSFMRFVVGGDGNIGISTSTPAYRLDMVGDSRLSGQFMLGRYVSLPVSGHQAGSLVYKTSSSTINYWDGTTWRTVATAEDVRSSLWDEDHDTGVQVEESADEDYIRFDTAGVERMYIQNDGKVGIGTTQIPVSLLTVGPDAHEASTFSVSGITGMGNIANFRDQNGENVFRAGGSVAGNDLVVGFGDLDYGGIGTSMQVNYGANAIELSHSELRFNDVSGHDYVGFISPAVLATNTIWTLPGADGTVNGQALATNASGTLYWRNVDGAGSVWDADGDTGIQVDNGTDNDQIELFSIGNKVAQFGNTPGNYSFEIYDISGNRIIGPGVTYIDPGAGAEDQNIGIGDLDDADNGTWLGVDTGAQKFGFNNGDIAFVSGKIGTSITEYRELLVNGSNYVGFRAPANIAANVAWTLPGADGTNNQVLITNGAGTLSWATSSDLVENIYTADGYLASDRIVNGIGRGLNVSTTNGGYFDADIRDGSDLGFVHVRSDEVEMNVANPSSYSGLVFNSGGVSFTHNGSGSTTQFYIGSNMTLTDNMNLRGIEYTADYSANYTNRTLVDKEYVDNAITSSTVSAGNGLTLDSGVLKLGGALTEMTYIDHMGYDLVVREFAGEAETLFAGDNFKIQSGTHEIRFGIGGPTAVGLTLENPSSTFSMFTFADYVSVTSSRSDFLGLVYDKDYSNYFVDRSLVDKEYVDSHVGALTFQDVADNTIAADGYVYYETGAAATEDDGGVFKIEALPGGYEVEMAEAGGTKLNFKSANGLDPAAVVFYDARATTTGIEYGADYSADFTLRSLVDKAYVDNYLSASAGSGLTWDAINNEIDLGGNLTQSTTINYGNFDFRIQNANNYQLFNTTNYANYISDGVTYTNLLQNKNNIQFSGSAGFVGATYLADYSANYTNRSLVDKEYVDSHFGGTVTLQGAADNSIAAEGYVYFDTGAAVYEDDGGYLQIRAKANGAKAEFGEDGGSRLSFTSDSGPGNPAQITLHDYRDIGNRRGIEYNDDFSAEYSLRSLVDKEYVDNAIISATTTLQAAYDAGGSALGRQIYTLNSANPVEILNPGTDQWETGLALTNAANGSGLAMQTMQSFGDRGAKLYFADDTSDPENSSGAYMDWNELSSSFEFGYQTAGTRNSSFYIDANQMSLNIPGGLNNGAFRIQATNYNVPVLTLAAPAFPSSISMQMSVGTSTPESRVTANSGSVFFRTDGTDSSQQLYVKTTDGSNTGWFALAGADSNHWQKNTNVLSPTDSGVYQIGVTNNSASTLTGFKAVNTNDASNYAGAVLELKGSGADFTNNIYFGKYSSNFYVPSWAGNGVLATDKNLVIGSVGTGTLIRFQVGGGYTAPTSVATLDNNSLDLLAGVSLNVGGNTVLGDATTDTINFTARAVSNLLPATTNLYSLGSTTNRWSDLWAGTVHVGTSTWDLAQVAGGALTINQNGGSERMRITSTGYVGIGTTTPAYRLDLAGDARVSAQLMLGQYALNPVSGSQAGAMIYNTASSTPFFWNGSEWKALNGGIPNAIWDVTHDTGITTEYLPDEDILRFFTGDINYFTMEGPHLSVLNSGNSVFFGQGAGRSDNYATNRQNVYIGTSAGYSNSTGLYNVIMGYEAVYSHASPNNTTAIGHGAGRNYAGAFGGTMIGYRAGFDSSGNDNVMVGYESGMENTGSDNFFMGRGTGWYNTGNNNIMMGYYTGYDNKGSSNILFGVSAGSENRGNRAIFLGESAGRVNVGDDNIFMGYESGRSNATGTRNLFLGRQAGYSNVLGNGNIFLGYQAGYGETNSDRLYIDNSNTSAPLVYGEFDTNVFRINGALQINNPSSTGYALPTTDGNSGQVLITNGSGNAVWVSSSVLGADTFQDVTDRGAITTNWIQFAGATSTGHIIPGTHDTYSLGNTDYRWSDIWGSNLHIGTSTWDLAQADNGAFTISQRDNSEMMRITPDGNIGLGTEVPEELLSLNSDMLIGQWDGGILPSGGYSRQMIIRATDGALPGIQGTAYTTYQRNGVNIVQMGLDTSDNMAFSHYSGSWVRDMVISTAGNVGIGNTVPSRRLDVLGSTTPGDNLFRAAGGANGAYLSMYASTTDDRNMVIEVQRNLQFYSQANAVMSLNNDGTVGFGTDSIDARINVAQSAGIAAAFNRTNDDGTIVSLRQDGVEEGTISVSANTISYNAFTGSHYAWTDETIEKGLLVALTGENRYLNNNPQSEIIYGITKSSTVNDSKVMGAYLSLQEPSKSHGDKNPHLIMAVGNGEVWVADKGENINIGDYLISSDVAGHAQKDTGEFMVSHIVARAAQSVDWTHVSETINGVKHRKISVFFESFDKNNMQGSLAGTSLQGGENNVEAVDLVVANAVFEGNVTVKGHLAMGRDTVGQAMVLVGDTKVRIDFEEDYGTLPIITLTPAGKVTVPYWVENASLQGFDLVLGEVQYTDVIFNWHAFGSHEGKVFVSNGTTLDIIANDMGTSELETQISANGTTPVPAPVEETEPVAPIADQPVPEEPEVVDEPAVVDEGTVEQNEYSEEQEIVVQEESQPVESNESIVQEPETEPVPQAEIIEEQVIE